MQYLQYIPYIFYALIAIAAIFIVAKRLIIKKSGIECEAEVIA